MAQSAFAAGYAAFEASLKVPYEERAQFDHAPAHKDSIYKAEWGRGWEKACDYYHAAAESAQTRAERNFGC